MSTPLRPPQRPNFDDLVAIDKRPANAAVARRSPITDFESTMSDDVVNNGFASALVSRRGRQGIRATRRTFLRSAVATAAASTALSVANLFGPARRVEAQGGVIGQYPRRILTFCPPLNSNDNCQPGCGSSPICTDCCGSDGFFRNDPANGYSLFPGGCGDGDIADGWLWRFDGVCGSCASIEYRCSDGFVQTDTGPAPFICRAVTACEPLPEGTNANNLPDAAVDTDWRPGGAVELITDNGGSVTLRGWIADATGQPVRMRITVDGAIKHVGDAALPRADIAASVRGAGPNSGFSVSMPLDPGTYRFCVDALNGAITSTIGCANLTVGSGQAVRPGGGSFLPNAPEPTAAPSEPEATPAPTPVPTAAPASVELTVPTDVEPSDSPSLGAVRVLRRADATTGFVSGWAGDPDSDDPVFIDVLVDGESAALTTTELPRPDVASAFADLGPDTGFATSFPLGGGQTTVCVEAIDPIDGRRWPLGCRTLGAAIGADEEPVPTAPTAEGEAVDPAPTIWGEVDMIETDGPLARLDGWACLANDPDAELVVTVRDGLGRTFTGRPSTPHPRPASLGIDADCGFSVEADLGPGTHDLRVEVGPEGETAQLLASTTVEIT